MRFLLHFVVGKQGVVLPRHNVSGGAGGVHINDALVAAAALRYGGISGHYGGIQRNDLPAESEPYAQKTQGSAIKNVPGHRPGTLQFVKQSHSWSMECVGVTIGRPTIWRSIAFSAAGFL